MKKFVFGLAAAKFVLLSVFFGISFAACQTANLQTIENPSSAAAAQAASPPPAPASASDDNIDRPTSEPYTGDLSIFEGENRAKNLQIERVMDLLKISEGKSVADIGAGSGWFTVRAAKRAGEEGKVYAVEINQEYIDYINKRAEKENFKNIQTVLGTFENPNLPEKSVDAVLILKTYHEIAEPIKVMRNVRKALRENALVGIIDRRGKGDDHGIDKEKVIKELKRAGFEKTAEYDFTKADGMDYFLVFRAAR